MQLLVAPDLFEFLLLMSEILRGISDSVLRLSLMPGCCPRRSCFLYIDMVRNRTTRTSRLLVRPEQLETVGINTTC
jgi:hypothetical protein